MAFENCYQDARRAQAYANLEFARTYLLAYRDLPELIAGHVRGTDALDFGCGTGRSSRFLQKLGFRVTGVDISPDMLAKARETDPRGDYRLIADSDFRQFAPGSFDLVLAMFTFDNIAGEKKIALFRGLAHLLKPAGKIISVVSAPEIYTHEWASFSTRDFPENEFAKSGDVVRIVVTDHGDFRPVEDILWTDESYQEVYRQVGLETVATLKPLARGDEPYAWVSETSIAPWVIYVLRAAASR